MDKKTPPGATVANNTPVGSAGQPFNFDGKKKGVSEGKSAAIKRRMEKKKQETGKK